MTAIVRDALVVALLLAAIASGLFFHGDNDIIYAAALGFLLVAAGFAVLTRRTYALPQGAVVWLLLALWGWLTLSLCWSTVPFASLLTWLVFAAFPLATLSFGQTRWVVPATFVGLALLAAVDLCQLAWRPATYGPRAHWPLLDANNLAALFNLGLAPALAAALRRERWTAPTLATGVLLAGIVATQSRAGMLAALVVMMMLVWLLRGPAIVRRVSGVISATVLFTLPLLLAGLLSGVAHRIAVAPASDANLAARLAIWRGAARLVAAHPWRGTGFGTFYLYYPAVRPPLLDNSTGNWAHNDLLQYAAEAGVPAALLLAALILAIGWRVAAALRTAAPLLRNEIAGCVAGLFALALQAQVEFQFYVLPTLIVAGLWLARLLQLTGAPTQPLGVWHRPYAVPLAAAGVLLPLAALTASSAGGIYYFRRAAADIADARVGAFLDDTARAEKNRAIHLCRTESATGRFFISISAASRRRCSRTGSARKCSPPPATCWRRRRPPILPGLRSIASRRSSRRCKRRPIPPPNTGCSPVPSRRTR